ncbi:hypothetical protein K440DRAFT_642506 [Wilcoxina mikolae CBS 423.85]|nr:hypothetical protein K440DRAFT_642506 [Wilcoxina mikolae CBS 423.85]
MYLFLLLSVLFFSFCAAIPATSPVPNSLLGLQTSPTSFHDHAYKKCKELGIDPHGPHPDDFTSDDGARKFFEEGSRFSYWVSAQLSEKFLVESDKKGKRDDKSVNVVYFPPPLPPQKE